MPVPAGYTLDQPEAVSSLADLKKEAAQRKPRAATPPKGYTLDSVDDFPQTGYVTPENQAAIPWPGEYAQRLATEEAEHARPLKPAQADPGLQWLGEAGKAYAHTKGIGIEEGKDLSREVRDHWLENLVGGPALQAAKGLYGEAKRSLSELKQGAAAAPDEAPAAYLRHVIAGTATPEETRAAAALLSHLISSVPVVGPALDVSAEAAQARGMNAPGRSYLENLGIAATTPGTVGTIAGTADQAAVLILGGYEGLKNHLAKRIGTPGEVLPPAPQAAAEAAPAAEPPTINAETIRPRGLPEPGTEAGPSDGGAPGLGGRGPAGPRRLPPPAVGPTAAAPPSTPIAAEDLGLGEEQAGGGAEAPTENPEAPQSGTQTQTQTEENKPKQAQVLEEDILDRIARHGEVTEAVRADLATLGPDEIKNAIATIRQEGEAAFDRGDMKAALEAAHHEILLEPPAVGPIAAAPPPAALVPQGTSAPPEAFSPPVVAEAAPPQVPLETPPVAAPEPPVPVPLLTPPAPVAESPEAPGGYVAGIAKKPPAVGLTATSSEPTSPLVTPEPADIDLVTPPSAPEVLPKFKFGNTQAPVPKDSEAYGAFTALQDKVDDADLAGKGKDVDEPHVTVRYGIQSEDVEDIKKYLEALPPFDAKLGKTKIFPPSESSDGAAVVNVPVESPELRRINQEIEKHGDFTEPTFKEYKPHLTVAYVSPDRAVKYKRMADAAGKTFRIAAVDITDRNGNKTTVQLKGTAIPGVSMGADTHAQRRDQLENQAKELGYASFGEALNDGWNPDILTDPKLQALHDAIGQWKFDQAMDLSIKPPKASSPALMAALGEFNDPTALRMTSRAIQQQAIYGKDQLGQILQIAKTIKAMDPQGTTNTAALIEAIQYGGKPQLEAVAAGGAKKINPPEVVERAKQVLAAMTRPGPLPKKARKGKSAPEAAPEAPIDVAFARASGGRVKIGADPKALAEVLGSSLYGKDPAEVIVKELMQNSWDAIRRSKDVKEVTVEFDRYDKKITVTDTGKGMTRRELETVFTDLGRTGKLAQADASGGFGIAKAAPFMMSKKLTVTTINEEGGKFYRHTFISTPDEIVNKGVEVITEELPGQGYNTGTVIEAELNPEAGMYGAEDFARKSQRSLRPPGTLVVKGLGSGYYGDTPEVSKAPLATDNAPGAKLFLHTSAEQKTAGKWDSIHVEINNNGIYQFDMDIYPPTEGIVVPERIAVDVKATVKERDKDYPFLANREDFRSGDVKDKIRELITKHVFEAAVKEHNKQIGEALRGLPSIKIGATEIPIFDSGKRLTDEEMEQLKNDPAFIDLAFTISSVTEDAIAKLGRAELPSNLANLGKRVRKIGIVFSDRLHGVHIADPEDPQYALLFINPFQGIESDPERAASTIWHTIKHELIHDQVSGHSETFTSAEVAVAGALGSKRELAAIQELEDVYVDPDKPGGIRPDLNRALQLYAFSRVRPETQKDIFRGEGLRGERATGREAGVRDGREATVSERQGTGIRDQRSEKLGTDRRPMPMPPAMGGARPRANIVAREELSGAKEYAAQRYKNYIELKRMEDEREAAEGEWERLRAAVNLHGDMGMSQLHRLKEEMDQFDHRRRSIRESIRHLQGERDLLDGGVDPQVGEVRLDKQRNPTLYLNKTAEFMISRIAHKGAKGVALGMHMTVGEAQRLKNKLLIADPEKGNEEKVYRPTLRLLDAAIAHARDGGIVVVGKMQEGVRSAIGTKLEEMIHRWQQQRSGDGKTGTHLPPEAFQNLFMALPDAAYDYLRNIGYPFDPNKGGVELYVIESAAKIMAGKWKDMGLTKVQAVDWLDRYYNEVTNKHGMEALEELTHTRGVARDLQREWEGRHGSGPKPEPPAGTGTTSTDEAKQGDDSGPIQRVEDRREGDADGDAAKRAGPGRLTQPDEREERYGPTGGANLEQDKPLLKQTKKDS